VAADVQSAAAMHYLGRVVHAQAYTMGFRDSFMLVAVIFTIGLIPAWIMGRRAVAPPRAPSSSSAGASRAA
jgi:hypothetical protein